MHVFASGGGWGSYLAETGWGVLKYLILLGSLAPNPVNAYFFLEVGVRPYLVKRKKFAQTFIIQICEARRVTGGSGVGGGPICQEKVVSHYSRA